MANKLGRIKSICEDLGFPEGKLTDEYLFTIVGMDDVYFSGNIGEKDIQNGFVDGSNDGGIDFVYSLNDELYLIQGKTQDYISYEDLSNIFDKMNRTVKAFEDNDYDRYNKNLKSVYLNTIDSLPDNPNINLVLFTNAVIDEEVRQRYVLDAEQSHLKDYNIEIYDKSSLKYYSNINEMENECVKSDYLYIDKPKNFLSYQENGIIINILASSLKNLYYKHSGKGLFNYNLREHISQKNVDDGIDNTIKKEKENFWYFNNGVNIACEDYFFDGNKIKLTNFSIINGAQTTTKIGKSSLVNEKNDFSIVCKIVKTKNLSEKTDFIVKISEASNSQKPIKLRDLRANKPEQKSMQVESKKSDFPLAIEIKRGVKPSNFSKVEKWQRVKNEYIGQIILATIFQKPGTARSGKNDIFGMDRIYNMLFKRTHDYHTMYDLVKLAWYYDNFQVDFSKSSQKIDLIGVASNGKFVVLAVISYFIKRHRNIVSSYLDEGIDKDNLYGSIISNYKNDDFEKRIYELFKFVIKFLDDIYKSKTEELKLTSYSNFFKTDKTYINHILCEIDNRIFDEEYDREKVLSYMDLFDQ